MQRLQEASGLAVVGSQSVWVGVSRFPDSLEHWDGSRWSRFVVPASQFNGFIDTVGVSGRHDVWAVGSGGDAVRWRDGRLAPVQTALPDHSTLWELASTATDDVWAAGERISRNYAGHPLIEHWDGRRWTVSFTEQAFGPMNDVIAFSRRNVWAIGWDRMKRGTHVPFRPFVLHWDGKRWHRKRAPADLFALSAIQPNDIWASAGIRQHRYAFARWHDGRWRIVLGPTGPATNYNYLADLAVVSPTEFFATESDGHHAFILHRDGERWLTEPTPRIGGWDRVATAAGEVWAVGSDRGLASIIVRCER
jgi:hypothetical protein